MSKSAVSELHVLSTLIISLCLTLSGSVSLSHTLWLCLTLSGSVCLSLSVWLWLSLSVSGSVCHWHSHTLPPPPPPSLFKQQTNFAIVFLMVGGWRGVVHTAFDNLQKYLHAVILCLLETSSVVQTKVPQAVCS